MVRMFWTTLMTNFSGKPYVCEIDKFISYKTAMTTALFSGVVMWIYYQGSLTSILAIKLVKYPFNDLYSFAQSNYK